MARKRPWSSRANSKQPVETVTEQQIWKHSAWLGYGWLLKLIPVAGFLGLHAAIIMLFLNRTFFQTRDPNAPGFFESVWRMWLGVSVICTSVFLIAIVIDGAVKARLRKLLVPARCQRCPGCFYDLSARARSEDTCPECGLRAPRRECVRLWCKALR